MRHRLVEETPQFYRMHDGTAEFRVPKAGLSEAMHAKIRGFADGGKIVARAPTGEKLETDREFIARRAQEQADREESDRVYEDDEGDYTSRTREDVAHATNILRRAVPHQSESQRLMAKIQDVARRAAGAISGMAEGGPVPAEGGGFGMPERKDSGAVVFVPMPDGGLKAVPVDQVAAAVKSDAGTGPTPAQANVPPAGPAPARSSGPSPDALAAAAQIQQVTGPAGAAALGRLADEPGDRAAAVANFQRQERAKLSTLKPREEGAVPTETPAAPAPAVAPKPMAGAGVPRGTATMAEGISAEQAALKAKGESESAQAVATANALGDFQNTLKARELEQQQMLKASRVQAAEMMGQYRTALEDLRRIDTKVDPGRYWASKSTGQKIIAGIGLALGAIGAGADGVNRAAMMMTQAVDRDIEAQKAEHALRLQKGQQAVSAAQSLYAMNRQLFQDDLAANAATKASAIELMDTQLKKVAATYASPIAKQNAAALSAQLQQTKAKFELQASQAAEEAIHHRNLEAAARASGAGVDKEALHTAQQVREKANIIRGNLDKAEALINRSGTFELRGADEGDLRNALSSIATDMAKLKDPASAARPGEVEQEMKNIGFEAGTLTTSNATARELLKRYRRAVDAREQEALKVRGFLK